MGIFARAWQNLNLTPAERALLKLVEGIVVSALIAGGQAFYQQLAVNSVDWRQALHTGLITVVMAIALAVKKYATAQGDTPLPTPSAAPSTTALAQQALDSLTPAKA